jgi:hypothetical protein
MKLSPWFNWPDVPVHVGLYQNGSEIIYQYWNGVFWGRASCDIKSAVSLKNKPSYYQRDAWRGILK